MAEIQKFSLGITNFLVEKKARLILVACNTASAASLKFLRSKFPWIPFVGMEPAVKPAVENTISRIVGVLATPATFQGALYASVIERFAKDVTILQDVCPGLVEQIEKGWLNTPETKNILRLALVPMMNKGIDTVVLGCTHYPFVIPLIQKIVGPEVHVIDPAPAVARQVGRLLSDPLQQANCKKSSGLGSTEYFTTASTRDFEALFPVLGISAGPVKKLNWLEARLIE